MSCFETSKFLKNPQVFSREVLIKAAEKLNWEYKVKANEVEITKIPNQNVHGEYAMKVKGSQVIYNSYYLKNGEQLVDELKEVFYKLNVEYALETIIEEFKSKGFSLKKNYDFAPTSQELHKFSMIGYSKDKNETEKKAEIKFTILFDGTVVSDSNYIPSDLHELADKAMESIENKFGHKRREGIEITRKEVPLKYKNKSYCTVNNKIKAKN